MGIFAIRSEGNNVTNRIVGSNGVRNVRNERPPLRISDAPAWKTGTVSMERLSIQKGSALVSPLKKTLFFLSVIIAVMTVSAIQTSGSEGNEMAGTPPSVGDTSMNSKSPTMAGQPVETVEFREIRKVDQAINGVAYSWHEYEFLTSANRCFIAVETVSPNKNFLSVREAKALLRASGKIPGDIAGFVEIRSMVQTIDGIVHSWREYEFVTSANRCFIAVELVLPNKKFLSVREAKALLRASSKIQYDTPRPDEMTVVPPSHIGDIPAIEEPFSLEPFLDQTTPKSLPKHSPVNVPDEDTEDRNKEDSAPKKD